MYPCTCGEFDQYNYPKLLKDEEFRIMPAGSLLTKIRLHRQIFVETAYNFSWLGQFV